MNSLPILLREIRSCRHCEDHLPHGPRPILTAAESATILIIGQAPGIRVHQSGIPWDDPSGQRLRHWMGLEAVDFYDESKIAIVPMGFCYPGTGKSGDLPPRRECAELWHDRVLRHLPNVRLTMLLGRYAQHYVLGVRRLSTLTGTVAAWREFAPSHLPLPHPSPRNNRWLQQNVWFDQQVVPYLRIRVSKIMAGS